jgi:hypothetical protein
MREQLASRALADGTRRWALFGKAALAAARRRPLGAVFPIAYNLRRCIRGHYPDLEGTITARPRKRLTRSAIIALAVP